LATVALSFTVPVASATALSRNVSVPLTGFSASSGSRTSTDRVPVFMFFCTEPSWFCGTVKSA
jgi:hypothetical protein